jgi:phosphate-selective porin
MRPKLKGKNGALELAYRLSWLDLNDRDIQGGEQRNAGLALNYFPRHGKNVCTASVVCNQ